MELKKILPINIVCTVLPYGLPLPKEKTLFSIRLHLYCPKLHLLDVMALRIRTWAFLAREPRSSVLLKLPSGGNHWGSVISRSWFPGGYPTSMIPALPTSILNFWSDLWS